MTGPLILLGDGTGACEDGVCALPEPAPKLTLISAQRMIITLQERGVDFGVIHIDLAVRPDWFLAISPLGKVPVLKVERLGAAPQILIENAAISQYLGEGLPGRHS
jgi:glutathione S-transferase